jgi:hypothetical protein
MTALANGFAEDSTFPPMSFPRKRNPQTPDLQVEAPSSPVLPRRRDRNDTGQIGTIGPHSLFLRRT